MRKQNLEPMNTNCRRRDVTQHDVLVRTCSSVHVPENKVEASQDGDDVWDQDAFQDPVQHRDVSKRSGANLQAVRTLTAFGNYVVAHLTFGVFCTYVRLALRHLDDLGYLGL